MKSFVLILCVALLVFGGGNLLKAPANVPVAPPEIATVPPVVDIPAYDVPQERGVACRTTKRSVKKTKAVDKTTVTHKQKTMRREGGRAARRPLLRAVGRRALGPISKVRVVFKIFGHRRR